MDIKNSILGIPYNDIKEYVDTRIQFESLILDKKHRTILDEIHETLDNRLDKINNKLDNRVVEINNKLNKKQDILNAGKNITINQNTISAKEYTKGQNINITSGGVVSAKGYIFNESNTSFSQGIGTIARNAGEHAEGKYNKSNIVPVFVDLGLSVKWASANIGATCGNTVNSWYGDYYAWGETETKSNYSLGTYKYANGAYNKLTKYCPTNMTGYWNGTGSPDGKTILDTIDDIATVEFGSNYRMPTKSEIEELIALPNQWVTNYNGISGLNGRVFTGTNGNTLFIPAAGIFSGSTRSGAGSYCYLWSSSLYSGAPVDTWNLYFHSGSISLNSSNRYYGFSVRCVSRINTNTQNDHPLYTQQSIGIGTSEYRQNAVEVMDDGSVYIKGIDLFDGTNPHESYSLQKVIQTLLEDRLVTSAHINKLTNQVDDLLHTLYAPKMKFIDLGISVNWAQYNAGVDPENLSTVESWYGDFYAWAETETKEDYSWATYKYANGAYNKLTKYCPIDKTDYWGGKGDPDNKLVLDSTDDLYKNTLYKYFRNQYRMPTQAELDELIALPNKWVTDFKNISGLNGRIFAKTQTELDGTFNDDTMLFIPAAGLFNGSAHNNVGSNCLLWSSSLFSDYPNFAWNLYFDSGSVGLSRDNRYGGFSVRCVSTNK